MVVVLTDSAHEVDRTGERCDVDSLYARTVVVGNGPVGFKFIEKLVVGNAHELSRLTVFGEEPRPAYDRVNLTSLMEGRSPSELEFASAAWYAENNVELRTGDPVIGVDRENRLVQSRSGASIRYDHLVLATGSRPFVPPIPGSDLPGVFVYRTLDDLQEIRRFAETARSAAVLGGGLLGLEAARALLNMKLRTHVVEMGSVLMPRQLDNDGAALLRRKIEELGITVHVQRQTRAIRAEGSKRVLEFSDDLCLSVDMIVIAAGIRPRDELARACGLDVGPRGGIVVDDELRTSDPRIFAIGECALHRNTIYGLAAPGYQMADVLATRLAGGSVRFEGSDTSTKLKLLGVDVSLCGEYLDISGASALRSRSESSYRQLIIRGNRLIGAVGVGEFPELPRVQDAIARQRHIWPWQRRRFEKHGRLWQSPESDDVNAWPAGAVVCACMNVTRGTLTAACADGFQTVESLAQNTKASTVCGSCRTLLASIAGARSEKALPLPGTRVLLTVSLLVVALLFVFLLTGSIGFATSVQGLRYRIDFLWRDSLWKQISGFSLLTISVLALLLSLRKRWSRIRFLNFGWWRATHGVLGTATVFGLVAHTGMRLGSNLNFWLMGTFLGINLAGALTGVLAAVEGRTTGDLQRLIRAWRPRLTLLHIFCFWPFPMLVAFHIVAVYYL